MSEPEISSHLLPAVLRKAAELQRSTDFAEAETGLTLEEILQIGEEVGLSQEALAAAARSVGQGSGRASDDCIEVVVPHRLSDQDIAEMVALLRRATGKFGAVSEEGGTVVWSAGATSGMFVNFVKGQDRTLVQVITNYARQAGPMNGLFASLGGFMAFMFFLALGKENLGTGFMGFMTACLAGTGVGWAAVRYQLRSGMEKARVLSGELGRLGRRLSPGEGDPDERALPKEDPPTLALPEGEPDSGRRP